jgi:type III secretory pathway component EscU
LLLLFKSTVMRKVSKQSNTVFRFCSKINTTYQGLLWATSILTLQQKLCPQAPCVVLGLKSVIWSLWTLCPITAEVWCAEICSCVFQYGLGQFFFMTEKSFEIRQFFLVKNVKLYISCFALFELFPPSQKKVLISFLFTTHEYIQNLK